MHRELVVQLIHGAGPIGDSAAAQITAANAWRECVHLAHTWGVLPLIGERAVARCWQVPPAILTEISALTLNGYVRSVLEAESGLAVLAHFQNAALPAVAFKGLAAMALLYPDVKARVILDVDVLIAKEDLPRAAELLGQFGFHPEVKSSLPDYLSFVRHAPGFGGNEELSFYNNRGNCIDLHWRLGDGFDPRTVLTRSAEATLLGKTFAAVCARDGLFLCVHHSLRNHFSPDRIMRDLMDLDRFCAVATRTGQLPATLQEAASKGLTTPLLALTRILKDLDPDGAAASVASEIEKMTAPRQARAAADLQRLFALQVKEGEIERDLLYLLRPREMRQILSGLISGGRRHLEMTRSVEAALSGGPGGLWRRATSVVRALRHVRPGRIRQLRTLARTKDNVGKGVKSLPTP